MPMLYNFKNLHFQVFFPANLKINEDKAKKFQGYFCEYNCDNTHLKPPVLQAVEKTTLVFCSPQTWPNLYCSGIC